KANRQVSITGFFQRK
nr:Chain B, KANRQVSITGFFQRK peptide from DNA polymerase delta subunit 3 [synthetic construct]1U76_D Chain D, KANRQVSITGFFQRK peptide from DNA polymerase delta subunit 3 [synthetic construct]1U76_F Chain F, KANRQVSITGFFQRK peptide from DNA polymerase delta subunit 3 [synthetic construct]